MYDDMRVDNIVRYFKMIMAFEVCDLVVVDYVLLLCVMCSFSL